MDDHNTTHEVVVPKKFNLNMIRALHPITNLQGKEKKNSEARETCSVAPWEYSQQNTDSGQMSDFLSFFFLALPQNLRDLSSPTRDPTHAPCKRKCGIIHSGPSGKFLAVLLFKIFIYFYFCLQLVFVPEVWLSLVLENKVYSSLQCMGFSLQWLLLLWCTGFSSWSTGIKSCGKRA